VRRLLVDYPAHRATLSDVHSQNQAGD